ncbi:CLUMA_CG020427, isoform A [Clunio marinus]|uniref:CLUMA_CG020427, isoform A n=1 Tax=Clunio marinus TaxID=568069 RepID=A0A1J1J635_9DIPT|nr:CLUMA_CG020427, isoform A [Clunio marinus]
MARVKSFLGCCQLETGGLCLGWFFFILFFILTTLLVVFGGRSIYANPHPLHTLIWLDIIIFWIIVIYSSWLMVQGIKTKNPSKIQPFRIIFIAATILLLLDLIYFIYKINFKKKDPQSIIKTEQDIFQLIEQDFKAVRILVSLLLLIMSIYIYVFVDSLHKCVRESRTRYYVVAKV